MYEDDDSPALLRGFLYAVFFGLLIWLGLLLVAYAIGAALGIV